MPMTMISFLELWFTFEIWTRILKKIKTFDSFYEKQNTALPPGIPLKFWYRTALPYRLPPPLPYTAQTHTAWAVSNPTFKLGVLLETDIDCSTDSACGGALVSGFVSE